jgi:hypothetical protein
MSAARAEEAVARRAAMVSVFSRVVIDESLRRRPGRGAINA